MVAGAGFELEFREEVHGQRGRLPQVPPNLRQRQRTRSLRRQSGEGFPVQSQLQPGLHPEQIRSRRRALWLGGQHLQILPYLSGAALV